MSMHFPRRGLALLLAGLMLAGASGCGQTTGGTTPDDAADAPDSSVSAPEDPVQEEPAVSAPTYADTVANYWADADLAQLFTELGREESIHAQRVRRLLEG